MNAIRTQPRQFVKEKIPEGCRTKALHPKAAELALSVIAKQRDFGGCYAQ
jgi:hypothetical protein